MVDRTVTFSTVEDAAITTAAGAGNEDAYVQSSADQTVQSLRNDQLNAWWHGLPLDSDDEDVTTKQSVSDANND
jgi:hypothetical protein